MKRILLAGAAALALGSAAQAQAVLDQLVQGFQDRGFASIEVEDRGETIVVEAVRDGVRAEYVYDAETGELLSREVGGGDDDDDGGDDGDQGGGDGEDGDRGHGNDADGFDDDNPGRGHDRENGQRGGGNGGGNGGGRGHGRD